MNYRPDGSYSSSNNPIEDNRYMVFDHGMYVAQIVDIFYSDSIHNNTSTDNGPQTLYKIRIIGGKRDGQIFDNAVDMQLFGGITNNSERGWKKATTLLRLDPANIFNPVSEPFLNGDVVYILFINGDIHYPVIIGGAKHASDINSGATSAEGQIYRTSFNGIGTNIDKDGIFTWTKAVGAYFPFPTINSEGQRLWDQFVPTIGLEEAFKLTADNKFAVTLEVSPTPATSFALKVDATQDSFSVTSVAGASLALSGLTGIKLKDTIGAELRLANGLVALGNQSAELLDLFNQLLSQLETLTNALITEAPAGFGAPLVNVATYTSVNAQITAIQTLLTTIKGSL